MHESWLNMSTYTEYVLVSENEESVTLRRGINEINVSRKILDREYIQVLRLRDTAIADKQRAERWEQIKDLTCLTCKGDRGDKCSVIKGKRDNLDSCIFYAVRGE